MSGPRVVVGLDQAGCSGWSLVRERGAVISSGVANTYEQRRAVMAAAVGLVDGDPRRVFVLFEKHDHLVGPGAASRMKIGARRPGAPVRSGERTPYGLGKARGWWEEQCSAHGVPLTMHGEVAPSTWRARVHGVLGGPHVKQAAIDWASRHLSVQIESADEAEAVCIGVYGSIDGLATHDGRRARARAVARGKRELSRQGALFGGGKP